MKAFILKELKENPYDKEVEKELMVVHQWYFNHLEGKPIERTSEFPYTMKVEFMKKMYREPIQQKILPEVEMRVEDLKAQKFGILGII